MFKLVSSNFENSLSVYFNFKFENLLMTTPVTQQGISVSFILGNFLRERIPYFKNDLNLTLATGFTKFFYAEL